MKEKKVYSIKSTGGEEEYVVASDKKQAERIFKRQFPWRTIVITKFISYDLKKWRQAKNLKKFRRLLGD